MSDVPQPLASDGQVTFDPASQSLLVKPKGGYAAHLWRKGHAAMKQEAGRYASAAWAHAPGRREIARGEPVRGGWLRFQLSDADYRKLVNTPELSAMSQWTVRLAASWVSSSVAGSSGPS